MIKTKIIFKNTVLFFVMILFAGINFACHAQDKSKDESQKPMDYQARIYTGAEQSDKYLPLLKDRKVGILTNQTGIIYKRTGGATETTRGNETIKLHPTVRIEQQLLIDFLIEKNIDIQKIYAPEHGFRGTADAGELIKDGKDTKTGLPIISLYGNNKKPTKEQLAGIDLMLFDLQDVGARFYTYISSLHYLMEACAENNIPVIVLDRPNPKGSTVDGPVLEMQHKSFVGMHPVPVLHGMTIGEYAQMINGEKWLKDGIQADLTVIPVENYTKNMHYSLPVKPSPNLPNDLAINLYVSLCFFEGTNVSVGRGTEKQFQIYGSPYLPKEIYSVEVQTPPLDNCGTVRPPKLYRELSRDEVKDYDIETLEKETRFSFVPKPNLGAKDPMHNGKTCYGRDLSNHVFIGGFSLQWLLEAYQNTADKSKFFNNFFVKLAGTSKLQQQIEAGMSENEIRATWQNDLKDFKETRRKYLLYAD